jgi:hypothetical protein
MSLVLEILLGVAILASFIVAYMSARTWPIYQVLLAVFLFLGIVAFFYLAARTLKTHDAWRKVVNNATAELERLEKDTATLSGGGPLNEQGVPEPKGIRQLQQDLQKLTIDRGAALFNVTLDGVQDGIMQLTLPSANHGLAPGNVVFAFSQTPLSEGGRYLGEFKVASVGAEDATKVQIAPNLPMTKEQSDRLAAAKGQVTLYTTMPVDDAALFASMDAATRDGMVPEASRQEFADVNRKLRDYEQYFHEHFVQTALIADAISARQSNIQRIDAARAESEKETAFRQGEKENLSADLAKFEQETAAIAQYQQSLATFSQQVLARLKATYQANRQMAADLTAAQLQAAADIDRRAGAATSVTPDGTAAQP